MYNVLTYDAGSHKHIVVDKSTEYLAAVRKAEKLSEKNPSNTYTIVFYRSKRRTK
jgi:hypothetical protein